MVFNTEMFLYSQLVSHREITLPQLQKFLFCVSRRNHINTVCLNYENQLWRKIMNVRSSSFKLSIIFVLF